MIFETSHNKTEQLVQTALMTSLILIGTLVLRIPIPMTQGYVHLGDAFVYLGVMVLGKKKGAISSAAGSATADIIGGFAMWAPWTIIIKSMMAFVTGLLIEHSGNRPVRMAAAMASGGIIMCLGYLLAERIMYGSFPAALLGLPWNIGQCAAGIVISLILSAALRRIYKTS